MNPADKSDRSDEKLPLSQRVFFAIPVIGWIARDLLYGDADNIWYALVMVVSLWIISGMTFGLPGIYLPVLFLVPVIFLLFLVITWG